MSTIITTIGIGALLLSPLSAAFTHHEARQCHPLCINATGSQLLAVNSIEGRLSVFNLSSSSRPVLSWEIPTGSEPVTVRLRNDNEAWVVNEVSDTVAIINLAEKRITQVLQVDDEPADVVFAQGKAFVSSPRQATVRVFDATTKAALATIALPGLSPAALCTNADGTKVYVGYLLSGNRSTILPAALAPAQPKPTNTALPAAPKTALIVPSSDSRIKYSVQDVDVTEINATNHSLTHFSDLGTHIFALATHPLNGDLWVANSDALNLTRFEPNLRGHFADHRVTRLIPSSNSRSTYDLNPGINYTLLPNPAAQSTALAQPTAVEFESNGAFLWLSAFNSDRVARVDTSTGAVTERVDLRLGGGSSQVMRGPRGLALHPQASRLYVLNKISDTLSTVDTATLAVTSEVKLSTADPMPLNIRQGRGFLYDARLSGNGTVSCATCHIDADRDGLAWDLGDPGGSMVSVQGAALSAHVTTLRTRSLHPMKGPLITQTLRGMASNTTSVSTPAAAVTTKFHWRGDKPSIQSFNSTFPNLLGGSTIAATDMDNLASYLLSIRHHPNPNRNLDRTLKTSLAGGNPVTGRDLFNNHLASHCITCHPLASGTDQNLDNFSEFGGTQSMKNPPLRTVYQRANQFNPSSGAISRAGFGLGSDGTGFALPKVHPYVLDDLSTGDLIHLTAFILSFDTGSAPVSSASFAVNPQNASSMASTLDVLENAPSADGDLVVHARIGGVGTAYFYNKTTKLYQSAANTLLTRSQLLVQLGNNDVLLFSGRASGMGLQSSIDRNTNAIPDLQEPTPSLQLLTAPAQTLQLSWPQSASSWLLEESSNLRDWLPSTKPATANGAQWQVTFPPVQAREFFRLRRSW